MKAKKAPKTCGRAKEDKTTTEVVDASIILPGSLGIAGTICPDPFHGELTVEDLIKMGM
jgi:hypothetical protein